MNVSWCDNWKVRDRNAICVVRYIQLCVRNNNQSSVQGQTSFRKTVYCVTGRFIAGWLTALYNALEPLFRRILTLGKKLLQFTIRRTISHTKTQFFSELYFSSLTLVHRKLIPKSFLNGSSIESPYEFKVTLLTKQNLFFSSFAIRGKFGSTQVQVTWWIKTHESPV